MHEPSFDNRCSSRYEAVKSAIFLGWWEELAFCTCIAVLRNLSHGGAFVNQSLTIPGVVGLLSSAATSFGIKTSEKNRRSNSV